MCNAAKHSPSCMCGFGPPYPPTYRVDRITPWEEEVLDNPLAAKPRLRQAGYDEASINEFATRLAEVRRSPAPRSTLTQRIRELLGARRRVAEETWFEMVDVPLYRFAAPNVRGAKVEYSEGSTTLDGSGWNVVLPGIGLGRTKTVEITKSRTFEAGAGEVKQVYVRVLVRITRENVYDGGRLVGTGYTAEVASPSESGDPQLLRRGVKSVAWPIRLHGEGAPEFHDLVDLALGGDTSGSVHKEKRSWVTDVSREVSVRLAKTKAVDVSALATVKRTRQLELSFELPAGHDYQVYLCNGFTHWTAPRRRLGKARNASRRA